MSKKTHTFYILCRGKITNTLAQKECPTFEHNFESLRRHLQSPNYTHFNHRQKMYLKNNFVTFIKGVGGVKERFRVPFFGIHCVNWHEKNQLTQLYNILYEGLRCWYIYYREAYKTLYTRRDIRRTMHTTTVSSVQLYKHCTRTGYSTHSQSASLASTQKDFFFALVSCLLALIVCFSLWKWKLN